MRDYVDYKSEVEGYQDENGWSVLGEEDGKLLLLSTYLINNEYVLNGAKDYLNDTGIKKLNTECEKYGNGLYAIGARSIEAEDVDRITGYNPQKTGNGEIYNKDKIDEYGNEVTYKIENGNIIYSSKNGSGTSENANFTMPDGRKTTGVFWGIYGIASSNKGNVGLYTSFDKDRGANYGIRAVIYIDSNVTLTKGGENRWILSE